MSTTILPLLRPAATPFSENRAAPTSGVSGTMMMTISDRWATALADACQCSFDHEHIAGLKSANHLDLSHQRHVRFDPILRALQQHGVVHRRDQRQAVASITSTPGVSRVASGGIKP